MCRIGLFLLVAVLMIGAAGFSAKAVSGEAVTGERSRPDRPASATTLGAYWYYCTPEHHCRAFSTLCGYIRPLYSGHYRSKTYSDRPSLETAGAPARLGRVHVADIRVGTEKPPRWSVMARSRVSRSRETRRAG
jgi:hypothetical protein